MGIKALALLLLLYVKDKGCFQTLFLRVVLNTQVYASRVPLKTAIYS
jgi:hypothetical protein